MKYVVLILTSLFTLPLFAQNSGIKGLVTSNSTNEPLISANVEVNGSGVWTEVDGSYSIALNPGTYELKISYLGFDDFISNVSVSEGHFMILNTALSESKNLLDQVTLVRSKFERKISDSPVSISVLNHQLIDNTNTTNVADVLDKTPGVQMIDGQANIRGGSGWSYGAGSRVMLLIDEMPALQIDAGRPNWEDIPVENIQQIEVIKGASSVLYGSSALNGIIHVRTKYATSVPETKFVASYTHVMKPKSDFSGWWIDNPEYGAPNEKTFSILHKQKFGKFDFVGSAFYADEKRVYRDENAGHMESDRLRLTLNTRYRISDKTTVELNGLITRNHTHDPFLWKVAPRGLYESFSGAFLKGTNTRFYIDPKFTHYDEKGNVHKLFGRYYRVSNENINNQSNKSYTSHGEYQFLRNFREIKMVLTSGVTSSYTASNSAIFGGELITQNNAAAYVQVDQNIGEKIKFTLGGRLENFVQKTILFNNPEGKDTELQYIGRVGLAYEMSEYTFFRASLGEGYRYPTITERFVETTFGSFAILPNPDLSSEKGWSTEVGLKQGFSFLGFNGFLDIAGFWSQYDNMMEFTFVSEPKTGFTSKNVGATDIKGIEVNIVGATTIINIPINILAGYTYIDPTYQDFENNEAIKNTVSEDVNILKYRNKHNIKADMEGGYRHIKAGVTIARVSHMINVDNIIESFGGIGDYRDINNAGYSTVDARLSYELAGITKVPGNSLKLSLVGKNILNEEYTLRPGLAENPRNLSLRLDFTL